MSKKQLLTLFIITSLLANKTVNAVQFQAKPLVSHSEQPSELTR